MFDLNEIEIKNKCQRILKWDKAKGRPACRTGRDYVQEGQFKRKVLSNDFNLTQ
jgi:hypothetical protein